MSTKLTCHVWDSFDMFHCQCCTLLYLSSNTFELWKYGGDINYSTIEKVQLVSILSSAFASMTIVVYKSEE